MYIYLLRNAGISRVRYGLGARCAQFIHSLERVIVKTTRTSVRANACARDRYVLSVLPAATKKRGLSSLELASCVIHIARIMRAVAPAPRAETAVI